MIQQLAGVEVHLERRANEQGHLFGSVTATDVAKGLALGADAYMTKPFSTRELVQKVAEMLGVQP